MTKSRCFNRLRLAVLLSVFVTPAMSNGNVWANQPHGGYAPPGYVPQAQSGAGFGMGMRLHGQMGAAPGTPLTYGAAATPPPMFSAQPAWPVPPGHPAWPGGFPGIPPGTMPASPALIGGVPWPVP